MKEKIFDYLITIFLVLSVFILPAILGYFITEYQSFGNAFSGAIKRIICSVYIYSFFKFGQEIRTNGISTLKLDSSKLKFKSEIKWLLTYFIFFPIIAFLGLIPVFSLAEDLVYTWFLVLLFSLWGGAIFYNLIIFDNKINK